MKIKTLDNRYKFKKAGVATHMVLAPLVGSIEIGAIEQSLTNAYGSGQRIWPWTEASQIADSSEWMWDIVSPKNKSQYPVKRYYRVFLRKPEQATYLQLMMSTQEQNEN